MDGSEIMSVVTLKMFIEVEGNNKMYRPGYPDFIAYCSEQQPINFKGRDS